MKLTVGSYLGWEHAFGDSTPEMQVALAGGGGFNIQGAPLADDSVVTSLSAELSYRQVSITARYGGSYASAGQSHEGRLGLKVSF